jgi:hypothetical protein
MPSGSKPCFLQDPLDLAVNPIVSTLGCFSIERYGQLPVTGLAALTLGANSTVAT